MWARRDPAEYAREVTKRLAYLTRYTSTPLSEFLHCESSWLVLFADCLGEIVREENEASTSRT